MNQFEFWSNAAVAIGKKIKTVLLVVAESIDSSPGKQGFKMLVREDGTTTGTIGGGIMEKEMIDYAKSLLIKEETTLIKRLKHAANTKYEHSGLICGGFQSILFHVLNEKNKSTIKRIITNLKKRENGILTLKPKSIKYQKINDGISDFSFSYKNNNDWQYSEELGFPDTAYIIGGGHVGLAVSQIMNFLGFYVITFDHRPDVFTMKQNIYAHEKIIINYDKAGSKIIEGNKSYVIIVTPAHFGDKAALASVLGKKLKYIGMMGSKRKIKKIFQELKKEGFSDALLKSVHSPVGLEIEAETPNEIAVSIAAEIIKIKNS